MFSVIGLSLDIVGAVVLALGLFSHMRPGRYDLSRTAEDAAHDAAFGLVGAPLLSSGFVFQSLAYLGVKWSVAPRGERLAAGGATILLASLLAWLGYGLIFQIVRRAEESYHARALQGDQWKPPPPRFRRLRFWYR